MVSTFFILFEKTFENITNAPPVSCSSFLNLQKKATKVNFPKCQKKQIFHIIQGHADNRKHYHVSEILKYLLPRLKIFISWIIIDEMITVFKMWTIKRSCLVNYCVNNWTKRGNKIIVKHVYIDLDKTKFVASTKKQINKHIFGFQNSSTVW